jgi:hypothetical protein
MQVRRNQSLCDVLCKLRVSLLRRHCRQALRTVLRRLSRQDWNVGTDMSRHRNVAMVQHPHLQIADLWMHLSRCCTSHSRGPMSLEWMSSALQLNWPDLTRGSMDVEMPVTQKDLLLAFPDEPSPVQNQQAAHIGHTHRA